MRASGLREISPPAFLLLCSARLAVLRALRYLGSSESSPEEQRRHQVLQGKPGDVLGELAEGQESLPARLEKLIRRNSCSTKPAPLRSSMPCPASLHQSDLAGSHFRLCREVQGEIGNVWEVFEVPLVGSIEHKGSAPTTCPHSYSITPTPRHETL